MKKIFSIEIYHYNTNRDTFVALRIFRLKVCEWRYDFLTDKIV